MRILQAVLEYGLGVLGIALAIIEHNMTYFWISINLIAVETLYLGKGE